MLEIDRKKFKINKIVFYNNKAKWGVLAAEPIDDLGKLKNELTNQFSNIALSGEFEGVFEGAEVEVSGNVIDDFRYGKQVQISYLKVYADPRNRNSVISFLAKSEISGISTQNAAKIYDKFKEKAIDTVLNNPDRLIEINGIAEKTVDKIKKSVDHYKERQPLIDYCTKIGLSSSLIDKLDDALGDKALEIIKRDPYKVLELTSTISFKQMDDIYLRNGGSPSSPVRLKTGLLYTLKKLVMLEGSTGCHAKILKRKYYDMLNIEETSDFFNVTIANLERENKVVVEGKLPNLVIYYKEYLEIEQNIATSLKLLEKEGFLGIPIREEIIEKEINNFPYTLNEQQVKAVHDCLEHNVAVLTGCAGSGKSSITKALYRIYEEHEYNVILLSPTAKACRRLEECTGGVAQTIHKFLGMRADGSIGVTIGYARNTVLIIDEASMMDILLFNHLLKGITPTTRIILVGDNNQLPSVQAGNVLGDLIDSGEVHVSMLSDVMRQQENSNIIKYCSMINKGEIMEPCEHTDFHYEEFEFKNELLEMFLPKYMEEVEKNGLSEVQVIAPYKKGELGMDNLNKYLQEIYQKKVNGELCLEPYRIGDRVRHTQNNYKKEVFNGEVGVITDCDDGDLIVDYGNKTIIYNNKDIDELTLSYAATVHSSQGSEYKVVFVILDDTSVNDFLHIRRLLYTAVSRGKEKVYILTKPYLVDKCIENNSYRPRITKLEGFLKEDLSSPCTLEENVLELF